MVAVGKPSGGERGEGEGRAQSHQFASRSCVDRLVRTPWGHRGPVTNYLCTYLPPNSKGTKREASYLPCVRACLARDPLDPALPAAPSLNAYLVMGCFTGDVNQWLRSPTRALAWRAPPKDWLAVRLGQVPGPGPGGPAPQIRESGSRSTSTEGCAEIVTEARASQVECCSLYDSATHNL